MHTHAHTRTYTRTYTHTHTYAHTHTHTHIQSRVWQLVTHTHTHTHTLTHTHTHTHKSQTHTHRAVRGSWCVQHSLCLPQRRGQDLITKGKGGWGCSSVAVSYRSSGATNRTTQNITEFAYEVHAATHCNTLQLHYTTQNIAECPYQVHGSDRKRASRLGRRRSGRVCVSGGWGSAACAAVNELTCHTNITETPLVCIFESVKRY